MENQSIWRSIAIAFNLRDCDSSDIKHSLQRQIETMKLTVYYMTEILRHSLTH